MILKSNEYILEIKQKYKQFCLITQNLSITFVWIPAHTGIQGNEIVDSLAKATTKLHPLDKLYIPLIDLRETFKNKARASSNINIQTQGKTKRIEYFRY